METDGDGGDTPELPSIDQEEFILEKPQPIVIEDDDDEEPEMRRVVRKKGRGAFEEEPRKRTKEEEEFQDQEDYLRAMRMRRVEAEKDTRPERRPPATREDSHSASSRRGDRSSRDGDSSSRQDLPRGRRDRDPDRSERSRSPRSRNRGHRSSRTPPPPPSRDTPPPPPAQPEERSATGGASETISLSIEETNALRASLGMAPLKIAGQEGSSGMTAQERDELEDMAEKAGGTLIEGNYIFYDEILFLTWGSFYPLKIAFQKSFFYSIFSS